MKAIWNGAVLAESDHTISIEGNEYFPPDSVHRKYFVGSDTHTTCHWKGEANYYTIKVDGSENPDATWYYPIPKAGSIKKVGHDFTNYVAFWRGVEIHE
jgi:uncharacterized protein (DUF427 family)